jgi:hypothetical protein
VVRTESVALGATRRRFAVGSGMGWEKRAHDFTDGSADFNEMCRTGVAKRMGARIGGLHTQTVHELFW